MHLRARAAAFLLLAAALGGPLVASPAAAASCPHGLPIRVQTLTSNAAALRRVGVVRAIVGGGARVRDLRVRLERGGRMVAKGSRGPAFAGTVPVRLAFPRSPAPGRVSLVVSGRLVGCAASRRIRRTLRLDGRDLPLGMTATDRDTRDSRVAVTLRSAARRPIAGLRARMLDARGATVAQVTRRAPFSARARLDFALRGPLAAGRYTLLVTASEHGTAGEGAVAGPIMLDGLPAAAVLAEAPPSPTAAPPGAVVQQVALDWSAGRWQGSDSVGFSAPGIGDGQIVCRPDTQWVRFFPADRSRDVSMMLWTFRDWEGGSELAIREPQMTRFTSPDFNEGLNKFTPSEKRSHGSLVGVVGDGLPPPGTSAAGRSPTEVRLTWSWDFSDTATARCSVAATLTSQGPGTAGAVARGLSLAWNGADGVPADTTATTKVPGLGTVRLRCDPGPEGVRQLAVEPDPTLPGLMLTTYEGSNRSDRMLGNAPYVLPLPNNGLVEATTTSGRPLRLLVSSRWKVNDPDPAQNSCRLSGIVVAAGADPAPTALSAGR
ncbi:MAG: hypothetical protein QOJ63_2356 [Solirubrobacteraceae bacterium]|nr:hypothetical protein [Solirubrobacteraceae bacterium]